MGPRKVLCTLAVGAAALAACDAGTPDEPLAGTSPPVAGSPGEDPRVPELEAEVAALEDEVAALRGEVATLSERLAEAREPGPGGGPQPARPGTVEGVEDALRAYFPGDTWEPGVTRWRDTDLELPGDLTDPDAGVEEHGALALRLVDAVVDAGAFGGLAEPEAGFPWEVTARVLRTGDGEAVAVVQQWGTGDDSVSGTDYRFELVRGAGGWHVTAAAQREQCTRNGRLPGEDDLPEYCV